MNRFLFFFLWLLFVDLSGEFFKKVLQSREVKEAEG